MIQGLTEKKVIKVYNIEHNKSIIISPACTLTIIVTTVCKKLGNLGQIIRSINFFQTLVSNGNEKAKKTKQQGVQILHTPQIAQQLKV